MLRKNTLFISLTKVSLLVASMLILQACSNGIDVKHRDPDTNRWYTLAQVEQGGKIFLENCTSCHGVKAQATKKWRVAKEDGSYPAPPLNGTAHTWHHPLNMLKDTIKNGTKRGMPAWKNKLNEQQIEATIAWIESHWPEKVYQAWRKRH
ncbi:MAG: cytochrome c [Oceanospirillaceae bacterium]|nr:cytochrome c [Oceanospirillaceae bacterium]